MKSGRLLTSVVAPAIALVIAFGIAAVALLLVGIDPLTAYKEMWVFGTTPESLIITVNNAIPLFVSALAVAVGFKMGLFNIGVEGTYLIAALFAAYVGAQISTTPVLHVTAILLVAVLVGAGWAWIPAYLKVKRGVHEVIATIMLNYIAFALSAYLFLNVFRAETAGLTIATDLIPESGWIPSLTPLLAAIGIEVRAGANLQGFLIIAIALGVGYHYLVNKSRFGYDLRASGINPTAANASGVDPKKMIIRTMLISGGLAGLVGIAPTPRVLPPVPAGLPPQLRVQRHRRGLAGKEQRGGDGLRRPPVRVHAEVGADPGPEGRAQGDRHDHSGDRRARRGHRL